MAKKKKEVLVEEPVQVKNTSPKWEMKDRQYYLRNDGRPLTYVLQSKSTRKKPLLWWDEDKGINREMRYSSNQKSIFVDEQDNNVMLDHVIFEEGVLYVPKQNQPLQKFLSLYHPQKDILYYEHKPVQVAENQLDWLEFEVAALQAASNLDIDMAEAVMRAEKGSEVSSLSSKELKRDLLLFAKSNPQLFLELVTDENIQLRNTGIKATEANILRLSDDQRTFSWASTGRKLFTVPFDEHPYSALAAWFKTDEGMEIYTNIEKRLK